MITNFSCKYIWISSTLKSLNPLMCYLCLLFCRWLNLPSYHLLSYSKPFSWKSSSGDMHMMKFITDSICSQFSKITEKFKPFCLIFFFSFFHWICSQKIKFSLFLLLVGVAIASVTDLQLNLVGTILSLLAIATTCVGQIVSFSFCKFYSYSLLL